MIARWALLLCLCATPITAQEDAPPRNFDAVMEALDSALASGDAAAPYVMLNRAIRTARAEGYLTPDWSLFFAMLADFMRNDRGNPAFALSLTQEGLALIAGMPEQEDFAAALRVSGAYALADLGRMDEAVAQARLALPLFREGFGDDAAGELEGFIAQWAAGELGSFNTSAVDLAIKALENAQAESDRGAYGRAIAQAAQAILPLGGSLPQGDVRLVNASAEKIMGQALVNLNRRQDGANAFLRAINHLTVGGWQPGTRPEWQPEARTVNGRDTLFTTLQALTGLAVQAGLRDLAEAALELAEDFAESTDDRVQILLYRAVLASRDGDTDRTIALITQSRERSIAAGDTAAALMADFYIAQVQILAAQIADVEPDPDPIIKSAEAALAHGKATGNIGAVGVLTDTARFLTRTEDREAALDFARRALLARRDLFTTQATGDTAFGREQARRAQRGSLETFLRAANNAAVAADSTCDDPSRFAYYGCVLTVPDGGLR